MEKDTKMLEEKKIYLEHSLKEVKKSLDKIKYNWKLQPVFTLIGFAILPLISLLFGEKLPPLKDFDFWGGPVVLAGLLTFFYPLALYASRQTLRAREREINTELNSVGASALQEEIDEDFFTNLVKINLKYLNIYYQQTQTQAEKSFTLCVAAAIVALVIIAIGIGLMYVGRTEASILATATGTLSEIIAAVFFYLYNQTTLKMREYHQKLVITQNISLALKITEKMPDAERVQSQKYLIEQLCKDVNLLLSNNTDKKE